MDTDRSFSNFVKTETATPAGGVLSLNDRDERALAWLIEQVGVDAVASACERIAGNRKPYISNVAKVLGLSIPEGVVLTPRSVALERINEIRLRFGMHRQTPLAKK